MAHQMEQAPLQLNQEAEEVQRNRAIDLYIAGKKGEEISRELGRSRGWFYKTLRRYQVGGREGLKSQSRTPKHVPNRTEATVEAAIVRITHGAVSG